MESSSSEHNARCAAGQAGERTNGAALEDGPIELRVVSIVRGKIRKTLIEQLGIDRTGNGLAPLP